MGRRKKQSEQFFLRALGEAIRQARVAKGFSQEDLAEATELHRTYVGSVERGERNVGVLNLAKFAAATNVELSALLRRAEALTKASART